MFNPRKLILRMGWICLVVALCLMDTRQAYGGARSDVLHQEGITVENAMAVVSFGQSITFQAKITTPLPIQQSSILFRGVNEEVTRVEPVQVGADGSVSFTYDASLNVLPPFSFVLFWFQVTLNDGKTYTSAPITFQYADNRFAWRTMNRSSVTVHWYAGDDAFGAAALDVAGKGLAAINESVPVSLDAPVDVYIYSNLDDLRGALALGGEDLVSGHANPALGVVLVAVAPGGSQSIQMEKGIPHELAHVMLYRTLGSGYALQPAWLLEGFASMMEIYPDPDYAQALSIASSGDSLLPFDDLCASFPADAGNAYLAYAQSQSFVNYIKTTYGNNGLVRLMDAYSDGFSCELGATNALGTSLSQLDTRWRESVLGQNVGGVAARNLAPFVLLLALVLLVPLWGAIDMVRERRKRGRQSQ